MSSSTKTCYFLNKYPAELQTPCDPTSDSHGPCCGPDSVCLSNGLCFQQKAYGNRIARGACTDQEWGDSCPHYCENIDDASYSIFLAETGGAEGATFCCGPYNSTSQRCASANTGNYSPFRLQPGLVLFPNTSIQLEDYKNATVSSSISQCDYEQPDIETAEKTIGIATGVSLGIPLLMLMFALLWQWRALRSLRRQLAGRNRDTGVNAPPCFEQYQAIPPTEKGIHPNGFEMSVDQAVSEMPYDVPRHELGSR